MFSTFKGAARIALAVSIFSVLGLTASAQTITPSPAPCLPTTSNTDLLAVTYTFSPGALVGPLLFNWRAEGDIAFAAGFPTTTSTTTSPHTLGDVVKIKSTGFGKGRLTAEYYYNSSTGGTAPCTYPIRSYGKVSIDIFKSFPISATSIAGPLCLAPGTTSVVYSVPPIISSFAMLQSAVGVDSYTWEVKLVSTGALVPFAYSAGDQSSISITSIPTSTFTVDVKVGQCNAFKLTEPNGRRTVQAALTNLETATGTINCRALSAPFSTLSTLVINAVPGVTYNVRGPSNWTLSTSTIPGVVGAPLDFFVTGPSTPITVNIQVPTTDKGVGDIVVKGVSGTGSCLGTQTVIRQLARSLTSPFNVLTGCMNAASGNADLAVSNAPSNLLTYIWTVPFASPAYVAYRTGTSTVIPPEAGTGTNAANPPQFKTQVPAITIDAPGTTVSSYTASVTTQGCTGLSKTVSISGNLGCAYTSITPGPDAGVNDAQYTLNPGSATCTPSSNATYTWEVADALAGPWTAAPGASVTTTSTYTAPNGVPLTNQFMRVTVNSGVTCLAASYTHPFAMPRPARLPGNDAVRRSLPSSAKHGEEWLHAYPNPATEGKLRVDVTFPEGEATLTITDLAGRQMQRQTLRNERTLVDVSTLPTGVYLLRTQLPTGTVLSQRIQIGE